MSTEVFRVRIEAVRSFDERLVEMDLDGRARCRVIDEGRLRW